MNTRAHGGLMGARRAGKHARPYHHARNGRCRLPLACAGSAARATPALRAARASLRGQRSPDAQPQLPPVLPEKESLITFANEGNKTAGSGMYLRLEGNKLSVQVCTFANEGIKLPVQVRTFALEVTNCRFRYVP